MVQQTIFAPGAIRTATTADKSFVRSLAKKFSNQLGFIPDAALDWYLDAGRVTLALENDDAAGYLLGRDHLHWNCSIRPITQAAIHFDAQRRRHGLALVSLTEAAAIEAGQVALQANCREGLDANDFWKAAGFTEICRLDPGNARNKQIICWRKLLIEWEPTWFRAPPPLAGYRRSATRIAAR